MTRALLLATALLLAACSSGTTYLPDGGKARQTCVDFQTRFTVKVVDADNKPVSGATVTFKNTGSGAETVVISDGSGNASVKEDIGAGYVRAFAAKDNLTSAPIETTFLCGDCSCVATPESGTVQLK